MHLELEILGNIGRDASLKEINGNVAISFSVAYNQKWKKADGTAVESTTWVDCTLWRKSGESTEIVKYLTKGTSVLVKGLPSVGIYKRNDGQPAASLNINVAVLRFAGGGKKKEETPAEPEAKTPMNTGEPSTIFDNHDFPAIPSETDPFPTPVGKDDDLPF